MLLPLFQHTHSLYTCICTQVEVIKERAALFSPLSAAVHVGQVHMGGCLRVHSARGLRMRPFLTYIHIHGSKSVAMDYSCVCGSVFVSLGRSWSRSIRQKKNMRNVLPYVASVFLRCVPIRRGECGLMRQREVERGGVRLILSGLFSRKVN